jgi:hypothetical protein
MLERLHHQWSYRAATAAMLTILALPALAQPVTPVRAASVTVITPQSALAQTGRTYGEWSAAWWQYVLAASTKDPNNPLLSNTGGGCAAGQMAGGPVFFLVGASGSGAITRNACVAPAGAALFFPLVNAFDTHVPGDGLDTPALIWADLQTYVGPTQRLFATVDGVAIDNLVPQKTPYYACAGPDPACTAPAFSITLAGQNLFGVPGGSYAPTVDLGYYLLLAPLPPGNHTLHFGGQWRYAGSTTTQDITYVLTVQ